MRNLTCLSSVTAHLPVTAKTGSVQTASAVVFNPESSVIYTALETLAPNGAVRIDLLAVEGYREDQIVQLASYTSISTPTFATQFNPSPRRNVLSLKLLSETQSLCIILSGGDIVTFSLEAAETNELEVVGVVDAGIKAASWSPDEELLILITGDDKLLQMTKDFDVLNDTPLRSENFGEEAQINVGWGSKSTQFHGSAGKAAAAATAQIAADKTASSPDDDLVPRVSWRDDGQHFAVSTLDPTSPSSLSTTKRVIRTYSRMAALQSTSEAVRGLEHPLAWSGQRGLIASTQRFGSFEGGGEGREGRHDVVFFERNGLRHGEFELREAGGAKREGERGWDYRVKELTWNSDASVLAVWLDLGAERGDVVQLWAMGNYHWYLKQEISPSLAEVSAYTSVTWHPEEPMKLAILTPTSLELRSFFWEAYVSSAPAPIDSGISGVVDGSSLLITPFRTQNVPPPMSTARITSSHDRKALPPIHVAFATSKDAFAQVFPDGQVLIYTLATKLQRGPGKSVFHDAPVTLQLPAEVKPRQVALKAGGSSQEIAVLGWNVETSRDSIWVAEFAEGTSKEWSEVRLGGSGVGKIVGLDDAILYESREGDLFLVTSEDDMYILDPLPASLPTFCSTIRFATHLSFPMIFALSPLGKLFAVSLTSSEVYQVAGDCTSFGTSADFLIFTTTTHDSKYAPLAVISRVLDGGYIVTEVEKEWERRRVERGALIVTIVSSTMSLVLQMPRGNLETIFPRPLVLAGVRRDITAGKYREAFLTCRKHRIDLNILYDHDPAAFMQHLTSFVEQIDAVDYINLFLSGLKNEDLSRSTYRVPGTVASTSSSVVPGKINKVCDAVRAELESRDMLRYIDSILTAHVVKTPPDHEEALRMLHKLKGQHPKVVEDAVKYVIFLADVNQLFDVALGMYDFQLVLMIAQYSQKDPREYLPFLKELRALDRYYQRFKIDDHLVRPRSALKNLHLAGPDRFEEAVAYVEKHDLHREAIAIWKDSPEELKMMYEVYGDHLYYKRQFMDAALAFHLADNRSRAMKAYEKAHAWKEFFTLALTSEPAAEPEVILELCEKIANDLATRGRHVEAGRVWLDYGDNVEEAVAAFSRGRDFAEAYRIAALRRQPELIASTIHPLLLEAQNISLEDIKEIEEQLEKQVHRLDELHDLRETQPDAFFMHDDPALENIDVMTDATQATAFTRYTNNASTILTHMTGRTNAKSSASRRTQRKKDRQRAGGRKGTVDEETYLLGSLSRLVERFQSLLTDTLPLLSHLVLAGPSEHREAAEELQDALAKLERDLARGVENAWSSLGGTAGEGDVAVPVDGWISGESEEVRRARVKAAAQEEEANAEEKRRARPAKPVVGGWKGGNGLLGGLF